MTDREKIEKWVKDFSEGVVRQTESIRQGDAKTGNKWAARSLKAFKLLRAQGDPGRDALATLLMHPDVDIRTAAAAFLLRYKTGAALQVLREAASGTGLIAFASEQAIKRWEEGTWNLDPE